MKIVTYKDSHFAGVEALWEEVFPADSPWNNAAVAIPEKIKVQPELFIVAEAPAIGELPHLRWFHTPWHSTHNKWCFDRQALDECPPVPQTNST